LLHLTRRRGIGLAAAVIVLVGGGALLFFLMKPGPQYDPGFDARVAEPAYSGNGPVVLFDEGHLDYTADGAYKPLADLVVNDGYRLKTSSGKLSAQALSGASVLVVAAARGTNDANDGPAFSDPEAVAIERWVRDGGSLLLITDHWPYGAAAESLARRFDVQMGKGLVEDPEHHDLERGDSHLVFDGDNGLLRDHPIVRGRKPAEQVHRVLTFTGTCLLGPPSAVAFMALSDAAVERPPTGPRVERKYGNVRVSMEYGDPVWAKGKAQGLALELDKGRVVMLGEAGMLRAVRENGGSLVGMNVPGYDNRQLALNVMHWLSRLL
jgi:hypothetical protein